MLLTQVDERTYEDIYAASMRILDGLPSDVPLGNLTAALMLAAMAFGESAPQARHLIKERP
jgi:hypothetical protein